MSGFTHLPRPSVTAPEIEKIEEPILEEKRNAVIFVGAQRKLTFPVPVEGVQKPIEFVLMPDQPNEVNEQVWTVIKKHAVGQIYLDDGVIWEMTPGEAALCIQNKTMPQPRNPMAGQNTHRPTAPQPQNETLERVAKDILARDANATSFVPQGDSTPRPPAIL